MRTPSSSRHPSIDLACVQNVAVAVAHERRLERLDAGPKDRVVFTHQSRGEPGKHEFLIGELEQHDPQLRREDRRRHPLQGHARGHDRDQFPRPVHLHERESRRPDADESRHEREELEDARRVEVEDGLRQHQ
jgi:hypothetical protein